MPVGKSRKVDCLKRADLSAARHARTQVGPWGLRNLEKATQRRLALQKRGPREKIVTDRRQGELTFDP
jgi:hypothetical protein